MDTRAPWLRTREWAKAWVGTISFWAVTALSAVAALFISLAVTGDWSAAAAWALVGAPIGVALAFLARWATTPWRDVRALALELAAKEQAGAAYQTGATEATASDEHAGREQAFKTYVGRQLTGLADIIAQVERTIDEYGWTESEWDDFTSLAWRTTSGLRRFDDDLGDYVTATLDEVDRKFGQEGPDHVELLFLAKRVVAAIEEARDLYLR